MASPSPSGSLAAAIADADRQATVLDDRMEIEDRAVFHWLKGHQLHRNALHRLVIGYEPLPPAWRERTRKFTSQADAETFLRTLWRDRTALQALRTLRQHISDIDATGTPISDADLLKRLAPALSTGKLWAIEAKPAKNRFVRKTSVTAFAAINPRYGTAIDFAYIARLEGDQWLRGYVPMRKDVVIGRSGLTVASGFDVGQWSRAQLKALGFPPALLAKIEPFAAHPFKSKTKAQVAAVVATLGPVPELTEAEADLCDGAVFDKILGEAADSWNKRRVKGVPEFKAMPAGWQTVWLSRYYQEGAKTRVPEGIRFRDLAVAGKWTEAVAALKGYSQYGSRAVQEAGLLSAKMPAELPPPIKKP